MKGFTWSSLVSWAAPRVGAVSDLQVHQPVGFDISGGSTGCGVIIRRAVCSSPQGRAPSRWRAAPHGPTGSRATAGPRLPWLPSTTRLAPMLLAIPSRRSSGGPSTLTTTGSLPVISSTSAACSASACRRAESVRPACARTTRESCGGHDVGRDHGGVAVLGAPGPNQHHTGKGELRTAAGHEGRQGAVWAMRQWPCAPTTSRPASCAASRIAPLMSCSRTTVVLASTPSAWAAARAVSTASAARAPSSVA